MTPTAISLPGYGAHRQWAWRSLPVECTTCTGPPGLGQFGNWLTLGLPFMEQQPVYTQCGNLSGNWTTDYTSYTNGATVRRDGH